MKKTILFLLVILISVCYSKEDYISYYLNTGRVSCKAIIDEFMWLNCDEGLIKYDYVADTFKIYNRFNTRLPWNEIGNIEKDKDGTYWMSAQNNYLYTLKDDEWKIYDRNNFKPIAECEGIHRLIKDKSDNLWIQYDKYILRIKGDSIVKSYYLPDFGLNEGYVYDFVIDMKNALWVSLNMHSNRTSEVIKIKADTVSLRLSSTGILNGRQYPELAIDSMNNLWIASDSGLTKYDGYKFTEYNNSNTLIKVKGHNFVCAGPDYLWLSGTDSTIYKYDYRQNIWKEIKYEQHEDAWINGIMPLGNKALISRGSYGLYIVDSTFTFLKNFKSFSGEGPSRFHCFTFDKYNRAIGLTEGYIQVINEDLKVERYRLEKFDYDDEEKTKLCIDSSGRYWCMSEKSIIRLNQDFSKDTLFTFPSDKGEFRQILAVDDNRVWLLSENNLYLYDENKWQKVTIPQAKDYMFANMNFDKSKNLIVIGPNGIFKLQDTTWLFDKIGKEVEPPFRYVWFRNIFPLGKGGYFLPCSRKSVIYYNDSIVNKIDLKMFSEYEGFESIVMDKNDKLWISSRHGISTYDGEHEKVLLKALLYQNSSAIDKNNNFWISTNDGFIKIINSPNIPDNYIKNTKLNYLAYNPISKKHDKEVEATDIYEFMPDNPLCRSIRPVGYFRNDTKDRYINFKASASAYDKNKAETYYEEYITVDSASLTDNPDIKIIDDKGEIIPFNNSHGLPPGMTARISFPVFECPGIEKSPSNELGLCVSSINIDLDTGEPFPLEDITDDSISKNISLIQVKNDFDFKESVYDKIMHGFKYPTINYQLWENSGSEVVWIKYLSDFGTNSVNVVHNTDLSITIEDKDYTLLKLNTSNINSTVYKDGKNNGDKLTSHIIDFRNQYGSYLKIEYSRNDLGYEYLTRRAIIWSDLIGTERRVISSDSDGKELNIPDKLIIEFISADANNLRNLLNPKEDDWITYETKPGNKIKGIPALTIFGGGGYSTGFDEQITDSILDEKSGLRENIYDLGMDNYYQSLQVPIPDFLIDKGFIRFRVRVEAKNNINPYSFYTDVDDFFIKDIKLQKTTKQNDIGIVQVLFDTPYSVIPKDHNVQIPIKIRIRNNLMTSSPEARVKLIIKNDTDSSFDSSNLSKGYNEIINLPVLNAYESRLIECPMLSINEKYFDSLKKFLRVLAYIDTPKDDLYPDNDTLLATKEINKGDAFGYDEDDYLFSNVGYEFGGDYEEGLSLNATSSPDYNINLVCHRGTGSGEIAVKYELSEQDTVFGFSTYWAGWGDYSIKYTIYIDSSGLPGSIIDGSVMIKQRGYDDSKGYEYGYSEYVKSLYKDPLILPKGKYWISAIQLDEGGYELGGSIYRMGMVTPVCDTKDGTKSISIFLNKYLTDETVDEKGKIKLVNRSLFAYRNFDGNNVWVSFAPLYGNPAYAYLNKTGTFYSSLDSTNLYIRGTVVPMLRLLMDGQYYKPDDVTEDADDSGVTIYPNPATDYIEINYNVGADLGLPKTYDLKIYNTLGKCLINLTPALSKGEGEIWIDVSGLAAGVYYIKFGTDVVKFVKM